MSSDRQAIEVDIACVGFGPAMGGFLTTLTREWAEHPDDPAFASKVAPGMPLQVLCYERADDIAAGVSGVVTRAKGIRASFPDLNPAEIPMAAAVARSGCSICLTPSAPAAGPPLRTADFLLRGLDRWLVRVENMPSNCPGRPASCTNTAAWSSPRPVQPVGGLAVDGHRPGADLAGYPGERADLLRQRHSWHPPGRPGCRPQWRAG